MLLRSNILAVAFALVAATLPMAAFSASCECFCGTVEDGGFDAGGQSSSANCKSACEGADAAYVGCFTDAAEYPENNNICWTKGQCEAYTQPVSGGVVSGTWSKSNTPDCTSTKSGDSMRYCYGASTAKIDLNVDIGSTTEASDLGSYVVAAYTWLIPAAALIAVVMLMIGGLQYAMSRGKSSYIDKGKKRMTNAIAGLVLLMSAYVIAKLIDPRLVSFNALKTPLVKEVVLLDPNMSCENLIDQGFDVEAVSGAKKSCGNPANKGKITSMDDVKENVSSGSWRVGDTCTYQSCPSFETCTSNGCAACQDNPTPTTSTCDTYDVKAGGSNGEQYAYCNYDQTLNSCVVATFDAGTPGGFNCSAVRSNAFSAGCSYYDKLLWVASAGQSGKLAENDATLELFSQTCYNDLCSVSTSGCKVAVSTDQGTVTAWVFDSDWVDATSVTCVSR